MSPTLPLQVDAAVFIALEDEFKWFQEIFNGPITTTQHGPHFFYRLQHKDGEGAPYDLVLVLGGAMGGTTAAVTTTHLLQWFKPRTMVNIGIAGGLKDVRLGDVVVPTQVSAYIENSKAVPSGESFDFELGGEVYRCPFSLVNAMRNFPIAYKSANEQWRADCVLDQHSIFEAKELDDLERNDALDADARRRDARFSRDPTLKIGHLASGPTVVAAESFVAWLKRHDRTYLGVEMEAAGMFAAASSVADEPDTLVIRGISDFSDEQKSELQRKFKDRFRRYAMRNATRLFSSLLDNNLVPRWSDDPGQLESTNRTASLRAEAKERVDAGDMLLYSATDPLAIEVAPVNPRYNDDMRELRTNKYVPDAIVNRRTIVVAVGREWVQDLVDRPVAAWIRDAVEQYLGLHSPDLFRRCLVLGDVSADAVGVGRAGGLISVGGPSVNRATLRITSSGPVRQLRGGGSMCFVGDGIPQVALWGKGPEGTRSAVSDYMWHQDGLVEFVRLCSPEDTAAVTISAPKHDQEVGKSLTVEGTAKVVPRELRLWLATVTNDGNLHPHGSELEVASGRWSGLVHLGAEKDPLPMFFKIKVIGVSEETSKQLTSYLQGSRSSGHYTGAGGTPHRVLATVKVKRAS
jgi:nucleoside phosphorylase